MKNAIVRINDIADIDTSRISIYDMNKRYVDVKGNMYGLKFDNAVKKIKIVRIMRALKEDAPFIRQQIMVKKKLNTAETPQTEDKNYTEEAPETVESSEPFNPAMFINDILGNIDSHKERLKGIMMNIKNSNLFPKENKQESGELENIFRNIDMDGILQLEKAESYEKELSQYPRSITYYQAKLDNHAREIIDQLAGDNTRVMNFIHSYEMSNALLRVYENIKGTLASLAELITTIDPENSQRMSQFESKALTDAQISITNTMVEIDGVLEKLKPFGEYLKHAGNF